MGYLPDDIAAQLTPLYGATSNADRLLAFWKTSGFTEWPGIEQERAFYLSRGALGSTFADIRADFWNRIGPQHPFASLGATWWIDAASESQTASGLQLATNRGDPLAGDARYGSTTGADSNDPTLLQWTGENYLHLPGGSASYAATSDVAALRLASDIDVRVRVGLNSWNTGATQSLVSKWTDLTANRSWMLRIGTTGRLELTTSADGSTALTHASTANPTASNGQVIWIRATLDVDDGSGNRVVQFFQAPDSATEPTAWTQVGTTITVAGTTSLFASTANVNVGAHNGGLTGFNAGKYYRAVLRDGINGAAVWDANFATNTNQSSFADSAGSRTVSILRGSTGRKSAMVTRPVWAFGADDYLEVADNDLLDFGPSDSFTVVVAVRHWGTIANNSIVGKSSGNISATMQGYQMFFSGGAPSFRLGDGATRVGGVSVTTASSGNFAVYSFHRDVTLDRVWAERDGAETAGRTTDTTTGTLANAEKFYIGGQPSVGYSDMELYGVAVFRRALTDTEIATITTFYGGA